MAFIQARQKLAERGTFLFVMLLHNATTTTTTAAATTTTIHYCNMHAFNSSTVILYCSANTSTYTNYSPVTFTTAINQ